MTRQMPVAGEYLVHGGGSVNYLVNFVLPKISVLEKVAVHYGVSDCASVSNVQVFFFCVNRIIASLRRVDVIERVYILVLGIF